MLNKDDRFLKIIEKIYMKIICCPSAILVNTIFFNLHDLNIVFNSGLIALFLKPLNTYSIEINIEMLL